MDPLQNDSSQPHSEDPPPNKSSFFLRPTQQSESRYLIVFGFIRQHRGCMDISDDLVNLMANWLSFEEVMDLTRTHRKIVIRDVFADGELQRIIHDSSNTGISQSLFTVGTNVISRGQTAVWVFKVIEHFGCVIGIVDAVHTEELNPADVTDFDFTNEEYKGYGYFTLDGMTYHIEGGGLDTIFQVESDQYLRMELDLSCRLSDFGLLTFSVYGEDKKKIDGNTAFHDIDAQASYKLALGLYGVDTVALMESGFLEVTESTLPPIAEKLLFD